MSDIKKLKQTQHNWLFLFQQGYALVALPISLFNFASIAYYLVVVNFVPLLLIFPSFIHFLIFGILLGPISCIVLGLVYVKSRYYRANYEIMTSANPYSFRLMPKDIPLYEAVEKLCVANGLSKESLEIKKLLEASKEGEKECLD